MSKILIVEDADSLREVLKSVLENEGFRVEAFPTAEEAFEALKVQACDCVLADFKLPGKNGVELLQQVREFNTTIPYIIMTAFGSIEIAVEAMKHGANDFITKPFEPQALSSILHQVIEHRRIIDRTLGTKARRERSFVTKNPATEKLLHQARKVARVDSSVVILGESGTGKELVARYIHEHSPRKDQPFIAINCAAMPHELLESEFFGYESGAFTGATQTRIGIFELASTGTIFLDEVGDMPLPLQVKLLRALQEGEIKRVGSNKILKVAPRIIAATNHNLEKALEEGRIREDFFYRLSVITLTVPPLRERPEDIPLLTEYFIDYFCNTTGKTKLEIDETALEMMRYYAWPGNIRELENVVERAVILADRIIAPDHLGINLSLNTEALNDAAMSLTEIAQRASRKAEIDLITRTLAQTMGNKTRAAQILGVSYKTLLNKVKEYNLRPDSSDHNAST
ncbi:MAG: sigma-54 dependent transcriptional regulator [Oligoflexia bacterium]|nr:sigma-54 dependent transcriptional regulator [Oligoflexia bacterium]